MSRPGKRGIGWRVFFFPVVVWFCFQGFHRGYVHGPLLNAKPEIMIVAYRTNAGGRIIFPNYQLVGDVGTNRIHVDVFVGGYKRAAQGNELEVYHSIRNPEKWISTAAVWESKPIFNISGLMFSWHLIAGILMFAASMYLDFVGAVPPIMYGIERPKKLVKKSIDVNSDST